MSSAICFNSDQSKTLWLGKELKECFSVFSGCDFDHDYSLPSNLSVETTILNFMKIADRKFSKWVENTVGKGEISPFPHCIQKTYTADT